MYKIVIEFEQKDKDSSRLKAHEIINKNTTELEKMGSYILKDYLKTALDKFANELEKDDELAEINDEKLDDALKDLLDDLKNLKETMKDKKKED